VANYNVDIDVAVRGYNRVEQNLKRLDKLIGKPRTFEISPFINVRKFRREQQKLIREARRTGAELAVAYQQGFERAMARDRRILSMTAGAGSRTLPGTTGPFGLLPATAVGQFQRAANAAKAIDASFSNAKRSIDSITSRLTTLTLPAGGGIAGLLPAAGGTGGGGGAIVPSGAGEFPFRGGRGGFRFAPDMTPGRGRGLFSRIDESRRSAALTGGAFPLLFGGGFGQAAGGAIGGLFSGKLFGGLTVALQVAGMAVDSFVNSTISFGSSLGETDSALQSMTERSLFSTRATRERAEELQALGETQELSKLLTAELASTIGTDGVKAFKDLGDESSEFNTLVNKLFISLQALVAGPLAGFLSLVNSVLGRDVSEGAIRNLKGSLQTPEGVAAFEKRVKEVAGTEMRTIVRGQGVTETVEVAKDLSLDQIAMLNQEVAEGKFGETNLLANKIRPSKPSPKRGKTEAERLAEKVAAAERSAKAVQREADSLEIITGLRDRMAAAELIADKQTANRLRTSIEIAQIEERRDDALAKINAKELPEEIKQKQRIALKSLFLSQVEEARADGARRYAEIIRDEQNEALKDQADILKRNFDLQEEEFKKAQELAKGLTDIVRDGFVDGIKAATDETRSLSEALTNMLNRLSDQLLQMAANLAFYGNAQGTLSQGQGIVGTLLGSVASIFNPFSGLTGLGDRYGGMSPDKFIKMGGPPELPPIPKALGGAVGAGRPYMVGERGPELFVPGAQGNIVPNNAMGSTSVVVNVDASGTEVQGNQGNADQLGRLIGQAVQAELIKQKRPGGLLTR
jgi:hypothetical protein